MFNSINKKLTSYVQHGVGSLVDLFYKFAILVDISKFSSIRCGVQNFSFRSTILVVACTLVAIVVDLQELTMWFAFFVVTNRNIMLRGNNYSFSVDIALLVQHSLVNFPVKSCLPGREIHS